MECRTKNTVSVHITGGYLAYHYVSVSHRLWEVPCASEDDIETTIHQDINNIDSIRIAHHKSEYITV